MIYLLYIFCSISVGENKLNLVLITSLRNAGFNVQYVRDGMTTVPMITDKTGQIYEPGYRLLGMKVPENAKLWVTER